CGRLNAVTQLRLGLVPQPRGQSRKCLYQKSPLENVGRRLVFSTTSTGAHCVPYIILLLIRSCLTTSGVHCNVKRMASIKQLRIALYARVSTRDKGQDPELQLSELREFAKARTWQIVGEFVDVGVSGSKDSRPQLDAMMRLAQARKID